MVAEFSVGRASAVASVTLSFDVLEPKELNNGTL